MDAVNILEDQDQLMTFYLGDDLYGIEVMEIQEVTGSLPVEKVPLAPKFIKGLINLRGQIATALDLRELFAVTDCDPVDVQASVVCKFNGNLVSLLVDSLGDVVETRSELEEDAPETLPHGIKKYLKSICKREGQLLSIIDLEKLNSELNINIEQQ